MLNAVGLVPRSESRFKHGWMRHQTPFHTRKLGEIMIFYVVRCMSQLVSQKMSKLSP